LEIDADGPISQQTRAAIVVEGPDGSIVKRTEVAITGSRTTATLSPVSRPRRWSPADPQLYRLRISLDQNGDTSDAVSLRFGWRAFDFPAGGPFYLNGARLLLRAPTATKIGPAAAAPCRRTRPGLNFWQSRQPVSTSFAWATILRPTMSSNSVMSWA
jgi:hypothetical protein